MRPPDPHREGHPAGSRTAGPGLPLPRYEHLGHLTSVAGIWEHAEFATPRVAHGFCTDDNARALIVACRQGETDTVPEGLAPTYLQFVLDARTPSGTFHNRRGHDGAWLDDVGSDDSQGRAWWGLGVAAGRAPQASMRHAATRAFDTCATFDSVHLRANAFAVLGATELLAVEPQHTAARQLVQRCAAPLVEAAASHVPWVEARLTYDNARLPEALLAAGTTLRDGRMVRVGLRLLTWLATVETRGDHFSFAPHHGWTPGGPRPGFDQQPVEAAAMADACHRAFTLTGEAAWRVRAIRAAQWFVGHNDTGQALYDTATGGTRDGLMLDGVNENRGAESTLAGLAALQVAATLAEIPALEAH